MQGHLWLASGKSNRWTLAVQVVQVVDELQAEQPFRHTTVHTPLTEGEPLAQVTQLVERGPLQVEQDESQLVQRKLVAVLLTYLPAGQVQAPLRAVRLPGQVTQLVERGPLHVEQLASQIIAAQIPLAGGDPFAQVKQLLAKVPLQEAQLGSQSMV